MIFVMLKKSRPVEKVKVLALHRLVQWNRNLLKIPSYCSASPGFNAEALYRAAALDCENNSVVSLDLASKKPAGNIGLPENPGFKKAQAEVGPHLIHHRSALHCSQPEFPII